MLARFRKNSRKIKNFSFKSPPDTLYRKSVTFEVRNELINIPLDVELSNDLIHIKELAYINNYSGILDCLFLFEEPTENPEVFQFYYLCILDE